MATRGNAPTLPPLNTSSNDSSFPNDIATTPRTARTTLTPNSGSTTKAVRGRTPNTIQHGAAGLGYTDNFGMSLSASTRGKRPDLDELSDPEVGNTGKTTLTQFVSHDPSHSEATGRSPFPHEPEAANRQTTAGSTVTNGDNMSAVTLPNELHEVVDLDDIHGSGRWSSGSRRGYPDNSSLSSLGSQRRGPGSEVDVEEMDRLRRASLGLSSPVAAAPRVNFHPHQDYFREEIMKGNFPTNAEPLDGKSKISSDEKWHFKSNKNLDDDIIEVHKVSQGDPVKHRNQGYPIIPPPRRSPPCYIKVARILLIGAVIGCGAVIGFQVYRDKSSSAPVPILNDLTQFCGNEEDKLLCEKICDEASCCALSADDTNSCNAGGNVTVCQKYEQVCDFSGTTPRDAKDDKDSGLISPQGGYGSIEQESQNTLGPPPPCKEELREKCQKSLLIPNTPELRACIHACEPSFCCYDGKTMEDFENSFGQCHNDECISYTYCYDLYQPYGESGPVLWDLGGEPTEDETYHLMDLGCGSGTGGGSTPAPTDIDNNQPPETNTAVQGGIGSGSDTVPELKPLPGAPQESGPIDDESGSEGMVLLPGGDSDKTEDEGAAPPLDEKPVSNRHHNNGN